jgi:hypothetical protein
MAGRFQLKRAAISASSPKRQRRPCCRDAIETRLLLPLGNAEKIGPIGYEMASDEIDFAPESSASNGLFIP